MSPTELSRDPAKTPGWLHFEATIAWRLILVVAAALLVIWLGLQVTVIAIAAFIAFTQAALLWPVVQWLDRFLPRPLAALAVVAVYAAAVVALAYFVVMQLVSSWPQIFGAVVGSVQAANDWFVEQGFTVSPDLADDLLGELQARAGDLASGIGGWALTTLSTLGSVATIVVVALFATLFALIGGKAMTQGIVGMVPAHRQLPTFAAIRDAATTARWWMFASTVTGAVDGILIGVGVFLLGVPLAVPIALLTFILGFIPMIGATVAGAIAVAVALFFNGLTTAIWTLVIVLAVQQIEGNVLSPLLMSRAMEFPPLLTLLLSTGGGIALGLPGLFLAVPIAGILAAAVRAWRRELPPEVKAAKGIGDRPKPEFGDLAAAARPRHPEDDEEERGQEDSERHESEPPESEPQEAGAHLADAPRSVRDEATRPSAAKRMGSDGVVEGRPQHD